jgi:phage gpG-like protein
MPILMNSSRFRKKLNPHRSQTNGIDSSNVRELYMRLNLDKINERLAPLKKKVIQAGILGGQYEDGTNIAYVAAIQEYGAPAANIPPRPFLSTTSATQRKEWTKLMGDGIAAVAAGQLTADDLMEQLGSLMAGDIQKTISEIQEPALSPITVMLRGMRSNDPNLKVTGKTVGEAAQRVANGEDNYGASTKPLVDIGLLLKSISYKVGDNS